MQPFPEFFRPKKVPRLLSLLISTNCLASDLFLNKTWEPFHPLVNPAATVPHVHTPTSTYPVLPLKALFASSSSKILKERGFSACAITDHGNLFGAVEFYQALEGKFETLDWYGCLCEEFPLAEHPDPNANLRYFHTQLLCQNRQGYQNLAYLASLGFTDGKRRGVPLIDHILLERYREGLIVLSGGVEGELGSRILNGRLDMLAN